MSDLDLHRAVGGLITGKVGGVEVDSEYAALIADGTMSGVTLFKDNARDLGQLVRLVDRLHQLAADSPFLVMVDQEGGAVQRFDEVLTPLPSPMALAGQADLDAVRAIMRVSARQLRLLGVNCCLAPVLDINSNSRNPIIGTRSFGADRRRVVEVARVVASAYLSEGVLPVGKHFPGHGDTLEDSHLALAVVHADKRMVHERELYPFRQFSVSELPSMLVGHIWMTGFDEEMLPASLSSNVIQGLLRHEMGYDGFLMSDDMPVMRAIVDHWGLQEAAVMAVNAGLDNLLISGMPEQIRSVHQALFDAVRAGEISEARVESALRRRAAAMSVCSAERPASLAEREALLAADVAEGNKLALEVSARCHAIVRGAIPNVVNSPADWALVVPSHPRYPLDLLGALSAHVPAGAAALQERRYSLKPTTDEIADVVTFVGDRRCLLVTFRGLLNMEQLALARAIAGAGAAGLVVASDVPYELLELAPEWPNAIATFDPSPLAMQSLALVLSGNSQPSGSLSLAACPPY